MVHIRINPEAPNSEARYACGLGPKLPEGDTAWYIDEWRADRADCPGCNPAGPRQLGVPISQLSGNAMQGGPGWERFKAMAASWGHD